MIGRIRGILLEKRPPSLLVDVNGIAYELDAPLLTCYRLSDLGTEVLLYTHLVVREDAHLLFGFATERERALFRALIRVSSVGPKLALAILSGMEPDEFVNLVRNQDAARLTAVPGVGKKTAERLVMELRDRLLTWDAATVGISDQSGADPIAAEPQGHIQEAISALLSLGYKPQEAKHAVTQAAKHHDRSEDMIRYALRSMI